MMESCEPAEPRNQRSMLGALNRKKDDRTASHFDGTESVRTQRKAITIIVWLWLCIWHTHGHIFYM